MPINFNWIIKKMIHEKKLCIFMYLSSKWIWDYENSIKTPGMRMQYWIFNCWVQICNQILSNSSNNRVIVFKFTGTESPGFHRKMYIYQVLQWSQESPSNSFQAYHSKKMIEFWVCECHIGSIIFNFWSLTSESSSPITETRE